LTVAAPAYVDVDEANIPGPGPPAPVSGTRFNCNDKRSLADVVAAGGYDHCFVLDPDAPISATLRHESGRRIDLATNQIGLQVYTGQHLDPQRRGIALETQCLPDTPNRPDFGDCTIRPGDNYLASTTFTFVV
jgi:aldose 1-epimerase